MDTLGSMYNVISKRRGRVVREEIKEGASIFEVEALVPVTESFGFADVLRMQTSGQASPQMVRSHWEVLEQVRMPRNNGITVCGSRYENQAVTYWRLLLVGSFVGSAD